MVDVQTVSVVIAITGLVIGLIYYTLILRNANRTRQATLWMQLYSLYINQQVLEMSLEVLTQWEWTDLDDFEGKYGPKTNAKAYSMWLALSNYFEGIGMLVKKGLIDVDMVDDVNRNKGNLWGISLSIPVNAASQDPRDLATAFRFLRRHTGLKI